MTHPIEMIASTEPYLAICAVNQFKAARDMANGDVAACNAVFFECFDGSLQQAFSDVAVPLAYNDSEAHVGRVGNCCYFVEEVKVLS